MPRCVLPVNRYKVIIAEKPKAAEKIALALGKPVKCRLYGVPYWVVSRPGELVVVAPSAGHLFGPYSDYDGIPVTSIEWRPIWEVERDSEHLKKFYLMLSSVMKGAVAYINACDYDIEGSVIGYMIIRFLGDLRRAYRMKFSTLSPVDIRRAYSNLAPLDYEMVEAGRARHELDWLWGINVSRALMRAIWLVGRKKVILSAGRVQSPTLAEAVRRWTILNLHVPAPSFSITLELVHGNVKFKASPMGWRPSSRQEALAVVRELRRLGTLKVVRYDEWVEEVKPPPAFNLGDLQAEAYRIDKFSPMKTQSIAEDLYLDALISYPRTNSQKLPPTINYRQILRELLKGPHAQLVARLLRETQGVLKPVQGRKDDPAHPAIYPTGAIPARLSRDHERIYDLIVRRFLAAFSKPAKIARVKVVLSDNSGRLYEARGVRVIDEGWLAYYPYSAPREETVPKMLRGSLVRVAKATARVNWSGPPTELTKASLLKWMESVNIGTEGTRARIIEILFKRGYLDQSDGRVVVTDLGMTVFSVLSELFPSLTTPQLTREFEQKLDMIRYGRMTREQVISEAIDTINKLLSEYRKRLQSVGERIAYAVGAAKPPISCVICGREPKVLAPLNLCAYHYEALKRLANELPKLARALSEEPVKVLKMLASGRGGAGAWVREVARLALSEPRVARLILNKQS